MIENIGFTGHRTHVTQRLTLINIRNAYPDATWWHGGAEGFDTQIDAFCKEHGIRYEVLRPDYIKYSYHSAPLRRNDILVQKIDILYACYDGRRRGGTFYTINAATRLDKKVSLVPCEIMGKDSRYAISPYTGDSRPRNSSTRFR